MKTKKLLFLAVIIMLMSLAIGYILFSTEEEYTVRSMDVSSPSHFDILFHRHGGVTYHHYGQGVQMYLAKFRRVEQILHELVTGVTSVGANTFSGSAVWGITTSQGMPCELRAIVKMGSAMGQNYFDISTIDFDFLSGASAGPFEGEQQIEIGTRYVLHLWQSGSMMRVGYDMFSPERLRDSEYTLILYLVFG